VPLRTPLRLSSVWQGTAGLPPGLAQVVNEVPDCCLVCKTAAGTEAVPSPFVLSQAASYGEREPGLPRKATVRSALGDNLRGACGQHSLAASKGGDSS